MITRTPNLILPILLLGVVACKDSGPPPHKEGKTAAAQSETETFKPISELFAGSAPTIPAAFKDLSFGMDADQAAAVHPEIKANDLIKGHGFGPEVMVYASLDNDSNKLRSLDISMPEAGLLAAISKNWGEPVINKDLMNKDAYTWFNPEAGIRASLVSGFSQDERKLQLSAYMPLAKLLGTVPGEIGFQAETPLLGATVDELRQAYPDSFVELSQEENAKKNAEVAKFAGGKAAKHLANAKPKPSAHLELLPTEFDSTGTRVDMNFDDAGLVKRYSFYVSYKEFPEEKAEMETTIRSHFGEGAPARMAMRDATVFGDRPAVYLGDADILGAFQITVEKERHK